MVFKSRYPLEYPRCSLPTFVFGSPDAEFARDELFIDADDTSHLLTHGDFRLLSQRLALGLQRRGLGFQERLLLFSGNNIYFPCVFMGTIMSGGIFTGANPGYVTRELAYQLEDAQAKFLVCTLASLDTGLEAATQAGVPKENVFFFNNSSKPEGPQKGCQHWSVLLASAEDARGFRWPEFHADSDMDRTLVLNYSSGTTGRAKGVMITHRNYVSNITVQEWQHKRRNEVYDQKPETVQLCYLPMYHALAQTSLIVTSARGRYKTYVMQKFDFVQMMDCIAKYKISTLSCVPPILIAIAKHPDVRNGRWDLSSIRSVGCGAAPLGRQEAELFESLFKDNAKLPDALKVNVRQGWGMTELTCTGTFSDPKRFHSTNTVGELAPGCEGRIVKEDGSGDAAIGERGELWIRGPNVMKGYWRNERATAETLTPDGFMKSGDIAYRDSDFQLFIVDRIKELIKVKGNQVAPAELESILQGHPSVNDVAIIGVPHHGDEAPRAYVVKKPGTEPTPEEIQEWLNSKVSKTKRLDGGVRFIDSIPKNPSGKILRRQLRELEAKQSSQQAKL